MYWDDEFARDRYDESSWDVWSELEDTASLWYGTYREYWGVDGEPRPVGFDEETWSRSKQSHELGGKLLRGALALNLFELTSGGRETALTEADLRALRPMLRDVGQSVQIRDRVSLDLALAVTKQLSGSTERALKLLGVMRGQNMSHRASVYIGRATRLYVWGFEPEAAIMCRAALEAALAERLSEHIDQDVRAPNLKALLKLAGETGVLAGYEVIQGRWRARRHSALWSACRLQWTGNYAAHDAPALGSEEAHLPDAFNTLREFGKVLGHLFPGSPDA